MSILFSVPNAPTFEVERRCFLNESVEIQRRSSDWGKRGWGKRMWHVWEGLRVAWMARKHRVLVLCSVSLEGFVVALIRRLVCPRTRLVFVDFLIPRESRWARLLGAALRGVDSFVCIRTGDTQTLGERFLIASERCRFSPFPANWQEMTDCEASPSESGRVERDAHDEIERCDGNRDWGGAGGDFLYSAGFAHRDWETLIDALRRVRVRAILSPGFDFVAPANLPSHIEILPPVPPEEGRRLLAKSRLTVFSLVDTPLPCGPLVLLDAMMAKRPIVASEVNGTRDYLEHQRTAWLVSPGDPEELADAIRLLWNDAKLALRFGRNAFEVSTKTFTPERFSLAIWKACATENPQGSNWRVEKIGEWSGRRASGET